MVFYKVMPPRSLFPLFHLFQVCMKLSMGALTQYLLKMNCFLISVQSPLYIHDICLCHLCTNKKRQMQDRFEYLYYMNYDSFILLL